MDWLLRHIYRDDEDEVEGVYAQCNHCSWVGDLYELKFQTETGAVAEAYAHVVDNHGDGYAN